MILEKVRENDKILLNQFMSLNKLDLSIYLGGANSFYISKAILFGDLEHYL